VARTRRGVGLLIDLVADVVPVAGMVVFFPVREFDKHLDVDIPAGLLAMLGGNVGDLAHADGKFRIDRIFADDRRQNAAGGIDEIALRIGGQPDASLYRRFDVGIA
jgi:hypothetical protein